MAAASKAYYRMKTVMRTDSGVSERLKLRLYEGVVKPTLMLSLWTVPLKKAQRDRVDRTHRRHLRDLVGKYYKEDEPMVTCRGVYLEASTVPASAELVERRWTLLGHMLRLPTDTPASRAMAQYFRKAYTRREERDVCWSASDTGGDSATR